MKKDNGKGLAYYQNLKLKYLNSAKEAASLGDRVLSEYNLQFAEHYGRVICSKLNQQNQQRQQQESVADEVIEAEVEVESVVQEASAEGTKKRKTKTSPPEETVS